MKLSHVSFAHPIPIPGTQKRQGEFTNLPGPADGNGWTLEDEDGRITLSKGALRFYTYVSASCVAAVEPMDTQRVSLPDGRSVRAADFEKTPTDLKTGKRKR
jgi:hypothetical protein